MIREQATPVPSSFLSRRPGSGYRAVTTRELPGEAGAKVVGAVAAEVIVEVAEHRRKDEHLNAGCAGALG